MLRRKIEIIEQAVNIKTTTNLFEEKETSFESTNAKEKSLKEKTVETSPKTLDNDDSTINSEN